MSSYDYAKLAARALRLLTKYGAPVTRMAYALGTYNPATSMATPSVTNTTRTGLLLDFGAGQTTERGTLIQGGDKRLLLDPTAGVTLGDAFVCNGTQYMVVSIGEINPAGTVVLYDIHLKT